MSCMGCEYPLGLNKSQVENLVNKLVADGVLSGGLVDCEGNKVNTGNAVVLCNALVAKINSHIKNGDINVITGVDLEKGKLVVTDGTGTVTEVEIPAISSIQITANNKLVTTTATGETQEQQLPGLQAVSIVDGMLNVDKLDGSEKSYPVPGLKSITIEDGSKVVVSPLVGEAKEITIPGVAKVEIIDNKLIATTYAGEKTEYPLVDVIDVEIRENKLVKRKLSGEETEYQLPGVKTAAIIDGELQVELLDGSFATYKMPGIRSVTGQGTQLTVTDFLGQETVIELQDLVGVQGLSYANHKLIFEESGVPHEIELPYAHDMQFDQTSRTLSWFEGSSPRDVSIPYPDVAVGEEEVVLTLADGTTTVVRKNEFTIKEKDDLDITLKRGANFEGRIGVNLQRNGGIDRDKDGGLFVKVGQGLAVDPDGNVYVKLGFGFKLDDNGNLALDPDAIVNAIFDKFDGDGLIWRDGRLHVAVEDLVDAVGERIGYLVDKDK